jgi:uncharacterized protein (UPF0332 family)
LIAEAKQCIKAAEKLLSVGFFGYSASRAYYAMFHIASALLLDRGFTFSKHTGVVSAFGREFVKTEVVPKEFQKRLTQAYEIRSAADYRSGPKINEVRAFETIEWARQFVAKGEEILGSVSDEEEPET